MSMSDLELLQLVDTVKEKQRGPKGETGVGIDRIEQFDATGFTFRLTDGSFKRIDLPAPKDGEVGPVGPSGRQGEKGDSGSAGRDGSQGLPGRDGSDGLPGSSIETAVVNSNGHLLLGISDGAIIDVGRVVGPAGASGPVGATGLAGESGKDGAAVLSGPRAPSQDDGVEGDHWIDISSAEFSFFKRDGSGWTKLANLRQPAKDPRVGPVAGGGGTTGSGGGVDVPPVIIDVDPPVKGNNKGPIRQGDLWFDSDQLALYVATKDSSNNIVWVISIPGVTGVPGTQAASVPVVYPKAVDGEEWTNPLTQVTYRYNEPKKQWINVNGGIVSVQDKRPATPQTGSLWFDTEEDELTLYLFDGSVWVPASPPVSLDGIENSIASIDEELMTINRNVAINKSEVDEQLFDFQKDQQRQDERLDALESNSGGDDFLPTAGGELKGTLQINGSMDKKIDPLLCRADGYYMTFGVTKTGEVLAGSSPGLPFMAVDNWHVVTKGYLDSRVPEQGLFHETWWTFRADADRSDCDKGEFCADDGDFFMSDKNEDNHSWGPSIAGGRSTQMFVTIYSSDGKLCHTYEVNKIHFHEKYTKKYITEFDWTWSHVSSALVDGAKYKIVVPGFLT
jgi:hypothetical protein